MGNRRRQAFDQVVRLAVGAAILLGIAAPAAAQLARRVYVTGLSSPVAFIQDPTDRSVQYVVQQGGRVRVIKNGVLQAQDFLNLSGSILSGGEQGLLGFAFDPAYATTGRFFVNFTDPSGNTVVARFKRSAANPLAADPATRFDLRWNEPAGAASIKQPFSNHNGGNILFSPVDGYLYVGMGDGGSGNDPDHNAQNPATLLGKMLRVDVNVADADPVGYRVPASNPFVASTLTGVRTEIWAFGLRNPWRWSFDDTARGGTGALVLGDVGQNAFEEIDYEPAGRGGRNYGWRNREGAHDNVLSMPPAYLPLTDPIWEYGRSTGTTVTGGYVYRGTKLGTAFRGRYFFADFGNGRVWSLGLSIGATTGDATVADITEHTAQIGGGSISSFGVDADGELYIVDYAGRIVAIDAATGTAPVVTMNPVALTSTRAGQRVTLSAAASGAPAPAAQWQVSTNGGTTWTGIAGATSPTYTFTAALRDNTRLFRALFTNAAGAAGTSAAALAVQAAAAGDVDGDGRSDLTVWRPGSGEWFSLTSASGYNPASARATQWGNQSQGDVPLAGDIDGDGVMDRVVWRASTGTWYWLTSSSGYALAAAGGKQWGNEGLGDRPFLADIDGDGMSDLVLWRASTGTWYWLTSSTAYAYGSAGSKQWGNVAQEDTPLLGDFDGDGAADLAVWRPGSGTWFWLTSMSGYAYGSAVSVQWGNQTAGDVPFASDMDGDTRADLVVWRASTGTWYWLTSASGYAYASARGVQWGNSAAGDRPLLGDFDGDGRADLVVWRASTGTWFWLTSTSGYSYSAQGQRQWGAPGDVPILK